VRSWALNPLFGPPRLTLRGSVPFCAYTGAPLASRPPAFASFRSLARGPRCQPPGRVVLANDWWGQSSRTRSSSRSRHAEPDAADSARGPSSWLAELRTESRGINTERYYSSLVLSAPNIGVAAGISENTTAFVSLAATADCHL
jgi:hypothetical protein